MQSSVNQSNMQRLTCNLVLTKAVTNTKGKASARNPARGLPSCRIPKQAGCDSGSSALTKAGSEHVRINTTITTTTYYYY